MATMHTFKVKRDKSSQSHEFKVDLPTKESETDLIVKRYGSMDRMIECANRQFCVDIAPGIRDRLPNVEAATKYVDQYCDDGRRQPAPKVTMTRAQVRDLDFSQEQIAAFVAAGGEII